VDIAQAIEALDRSGIVHRDVKPSNILLTREGVAKLTDLGIAQTGQETHRTDEAVAHPGTPAYKSPEQATTTGYLDQRSDIYALGLVLYEMLTGRLYLRNHLSPRYFNSQVPEALAAVVMKALEQDPARRYQTAEAFRRDLERVRNQEVWGQLRIVLGRLSWQRGAALVATLGVFLLVVGMASIAGGDSPAPTATFKDTPSQSTTARAVPASEALRSSGPPARGVAPQAAPTDQPPVAAVAAVAPMAAAAPLVAAPTATPEGLVDVFEVDDEEPAPIEIGERQARTFNPEGDVDRVTFRVKAGTTYLVSTSNLAPGVDTLLEAQVNGQLYSSADAAPGTLASQVQFTADQDGTAVVTVTNEGEFGPRRAYDLSLMLVRATETPTLRPTALLTATLGLTATPSRTAGPTFTLTATPTRTNSPTPTITNTPTPWPTATNTITPWPTDTGTPTPSPTVTNTFLPTATRTPTPTLTPTRTQTPVPTRTPLPVRTVVPPAR
jgi:serine/threonine-protein kinase